MEESITELLVEYVVESVDSIFAGIAGALVFSALQKTDRAVALLWIFFWMVLALVIVKFGLRLAIEVGEWTSSN